MSDAMLDFGGKFSGRVANLKASAIREIFKLLTDPDIISLAGGAPAVEAFPVKEITEISNEIFANNCNYVLQYGLTEGHFALVEWIEQRLSVGGIFKNEDAVLVTSGGQQGLDLTFRSLVNSADKVVCEQPSFIGGLNALRLYRAELLGVSMQDDGINLEHLENILKNNKIKLLYTIPTFQNPTGITMSECKRVELVNMAERYDFMILEDDPYSQLRFSGKSVPSLKKLDKNGRVIYCSTFSKIFSPGMRVGYVCAHKRLIEKMVICKQVSDVHTNVFAQVLLYEYLRRYSVDEHIQYLSNDVYSQKCALMLNCIERYFPKIIEYTRPEGGFFVFCTMPEGIDSKNVLQKSIERKVAFVPGSSSMIDENMAYSTFRLNFSGVSLANLENGMEILGNLLREEVLLG